MKAARFSMGRALSLLLLVVAAWRQAEALQVGRRRIKCITPVGGREDTDALMDLRLNIPFGVGFVGMQALLPTLGQCPPANQIQPPWFNGNPYAGGGICPPEFYSIVASAPGLAILSVAFASFLYFDANRMLVTKKGLGTLSGTDMSSFQEEVLFKDIEEWFTTPFGLVVKSEGFKFFPVSWDTKSLEALLEERIK
jgi:hypothetical protein